MRDVKRWFGWLMAVLVVHLAEQFAFGIDELEEMKQFSAWFHGWFSNQDYGSVALIGLGVLVVMLVARAGLAGGRWPLAPAGFFGLAGVGEIHHIVKTVAHGAYFPGAVTAIAYVTVGALLVRAVVRELRSASRARVAAAA